VNTSDFNFDLPDGLIAQIPALKRDESRLLAMDRASHRLSHLHFRDFPSLLRPGDVLVLNNSKVIPARLRGRKTDTGGLIEILLLTENEMNDWWAMLRPAKRVRIGARLAFSGADGQSSGVEANVIEKNAEGHCRLRFYGVTNLLNILDSIGEVPLPPYIRRPIGPSTAEDRERYQTIYANTPGSVAAPTAGLHFTAPLLNQIRESGIEVCHVTLHVGPGTFAPVKTATLEMHPMHNEHFDVNADTAARINAARESGRRVIAVGTTSVRVLESVAAQNHGKMVAYSGSTRVFIYPPYRFQIVDALLTNFHLPQSTLLMLVSAFAYPAALNGREWVLSAYAEAVRQQYRFFSYGDAMFIS
jgi:S-adenosylmethionine:tRNA ribosyltransferase-isomerase